LPIAPGGSIAVPPSGAAWIDVSEQAADALGSGQRGTGRVQVEYVGKASLAGSDDQKLLAILQTNGTPASSAARRGRSCWPVLERGPHAKRRRAAATPQPGRHVASTRGGLPEYVDPPRAPKPPARNSVVATADGGGRPPLDIIPPRRPDLDGVY